MFIAIPKSNDEIQPGFHYLCVTAKSKAQIKRIIIQGNESPEDYEILETKEQNNKGEEK